MEKKNFVDLGISTALQTGLQKINITTPTAIQREMIPAILKGIDVIGQSETLSLICYHYSKK